jgi:phosphoribosylaminoimidazolecarboxamide formyltransferase / IMP cyclohydrolase
VNAASATRRALLSVYDKTGVVEFASALLELGYQLVSSGGTSAALRTAAIAHLSVEDVTGFPEMLDGRVKTLHPRLHGGILADRTKPDHLAAIAAHDITPIDLVVCNLYPFTSNPSIELIDVGGPSMVRAAAKNHHAVGVIVDPTDYATVLLEMQTTHGAIGDATRLRLAGKAFAHTAEYDAAIAEWFRVQTDDTTPPNTGSHADETVTVLPPSLTFSLEQASSLRYGENPHQQGARYRFIGTQTDGASAGGWWETALQHGGKELSYLNVFDTDAAWRLVHDLGPSPAAAIIKHANPCGAAISTDITTAYRLAHLCDPVSAFGGIIALNEIVTEELAEAISSVFTEVVVAPGFSAAALGLLTAKKNLRLMQANPPTGVRLTVRSIDGGLLVQEADDVAQEAASRLGWKVMGKHTPTEAQWRDLVFAWKICAHVSSNAIVLANEGQAVGIGAGQQSRVDAAEIAVRKAADRASGGVCASDAFFPFRDGLDLVATSGIRAVIEPGGSVRDEEVIAAADEQNIAIVFTGRRHFRH